MYFLSLRNTRCIFEAEKIVVFNDKYPMSRFHILVIPKEHIKNVNSLSNKHLDLLNYIKKMQ